MRIVLKIIIMFLFLIIFCEYVIASYYAKLENIQVRGKIKEPIIKIEELQDKVNCIINEKFESKEFLFSIKNYEEIENIKRVNEVELEVKIEIKKSDVSFPIKYELYEILENGEMIKLSKKENLYILKIPADNVFEKKFSLRIIKEESNNNNLNCEITININAIQIGVE